MKSKILIVLIIFVFGILNVNLHSRILSVIEGIVVDFDTGEPLGNAEVFLIMKLDGLKVFKTTWTDKSGKFKFGYLRKGIYAVNIMREGYATFGKIADLHFEGLQGLNPPAPSFYYALPTETKTFRLKRGKKKFVQIRLKKEAVLSIKETRKFPEGISYKGNIPLRKNLKISHSEYSDREREIPFTDKFQSRNWGTGAVRITIFNAICPRSEYEISLQSGEEFVLDHLLDFTSGSLIYGKILSKSSNEPVVHSRISLSCIEGIHLFLSIYSDNQGNFLFGKLPPGKYVIYYKDQKKELTLGENDRKEINFYIE